MEMFNPELGEFDLNICEEYKMLGKHLWNNNLEEAEQNAYFLYKRLRELNGRD